MTGFEVLDSKGEFIAWAPCIVVAKRRLDDDPLAMTVTRCTDGELMAYAPRSKLKGAT